MKLTDFLSKEVKKEFEETMVECIKGNPTFEVDNNLCQMFVVNVILARKVERLKEEIRELKEDRLDEAWFE